MYKTSGLQHLKKNLESSIYEGILKLGFRQGESVGIYYDKELLSYLLELENHMDLKECLTSFRSYAEEEFGEVKIELEKGRYKITVQADGVERIYNNKKENTFLKDLIDAMGHKIAGIDEILEIFHKYSDNVICEKAENDEFEYVVYFADPAIDEFKYCFTFDEMGQYYHRLIDYDYNKLNM